MTWDATAIAVTEKSLGVVEASMDYGAIAATSPISVGLLQWYATRARDLLINMRTNNPSAWTGVATSLDSDLTAHASDGWSYWSTRYLTGDEINTLQPVLRNNIAIQDTQAQTDINGYKDVAHNLGMDENSNTQTVQLFCNAYNQSPARANYIISVIGPTSDIDRLYAAIINDPVLGNYKNRYSQALAIIKANDSTGIGTGTPGPTPTPGGDTGGTGQTQPTGNLGYLELRNDAIYAHRPDGTTLTFYRATGSNRFVTASNDPSVGTPLPPAGGGGTPPSGAVAAMIADCVSVAGTIIYSQGPARLNYPASGYTDCSGFVHWLYTKDANTEIGTWTGNQITHGNLITTDPVAAKAETGMLPGDLIFYRWRSSSPSTYDHVALYEGSGKQWSHGGPGKGPVEQSIVTEINYALSGGGSIMVRRYI